MELSTILWCFLLKVNHSTQKPFMPLNTLPKGQCSTFIYFYLPWKVAVCPLETVPSHSIRMDRKDSVEPLQLNNKFRDLLILILW